MVEAFRLVFFCIAYVHVSASCSNPGVAYERLRANSENGNLHHAHLQQFLQHAAGGLCEGVAKRSIGSVSTNLSPLLSRISQCVVNLGKSIVDISVARRLGYDPSTLSEVRERFSLKELRPLGGIPYDANLNKLIIEACSQEEHTACFELIVLKESFRIVDTLMALPESHILVTEATHRIRLADAFSMLLTTGIKHHLAMLKAISLAKAFPLSKARDQACVSPLIIRALEQAQMAIHSFHASLGVIAEVASRSDLSRQTLNGVLVSIKFEIGKFQGEATQTVAYLEDSLINAALQRLSWATEECIAIIESFNYPKHSPLEFPFSEQDSFHDVAAQSLIELLPNLRKLGEHLKGARYSFAGRESLLVESMAWAVSAFPAHQTGLLVSKGLFCEAVNIIIETLSIKDNARFEEEPYLIHQQFKRLYQRGDTAMDVQVDNVPSAAFCQTLYIARLAWILLNQLVAQLGRSETIRCMRLSIKTDCEWALDDLSSLLPLATRVVENAQKLAFICPKELEAVVRLPQLLHEVYGRILSIIMILTNHSWVPLNPEDSLNGDCALALQCRPISSSSFSRLLEIVEALRSSLF